MMLLATPWRDDVRRHRFGRDQFRQATCELAAHSLRTDRRLGKEGKCATALRGELSMLLLAGSVCQSARQHIDRFGPKSRHCKVIYPRKRTSESRTGMSDMGQSGHTESPATR